MNRTGLLLVALLLAASAKAGEAPAPAAEAATPEAATPEAATPEAATPEAEPAPAPPADPLLEDPMLREPASTVASEGLGDMLGNFARTMLMLLVVLGLVYLTLQKGVGKLVQRNQKGKRMRVVERVGLDPRRTLYIVEVDGRELLIGTGEGGMVQLADLGTSGAREEGPPPAKGGAARPFAKALDEVRATQEEKEGAA